MLSLPQLHSPLLLQPGMVADDDVEGNEVAGDGNKVEDIDDR